MVHFRKLPLFWLCLLAAILGAVVGYVSGFLKTDLAQAGNCSVESSTIGLSNGDDDWGDATGRKVDVYGLDGSDRILARDCVDKVYGGDGHDQLGGGSGDDDVFGSDGGENGGQCPTGLYCGVIEGGDGDDYLEGNGATDTLQDYFNGTDTDILKGGPDDDNLLTIDDDPRDELHGGEEATVGDVCNKDAGDVKYDCEN